MERNIHKVSYAMFSPETGDCPERFCSVGDEHTNLH